MKLGNLVLAGLVVWTGYEVNKVINNSPETPASGSISSTTSPTVSSVLANANISTPNISATISSGFGSSGCLVGTSNSAWGSFVGQPRFTQVLTPNDPNSLNSHSTSYFDIFRKQPSAFSIYNGYKG